MLVCGCWGFYVLKGLALALWLWRQLNSSMPCTSAAATSSAGEICTLKMSFARPLLQPGNSEGARQEAARALSNLSCNNDVNQGRHSREAGAPVAADLQLELQLVGMQAAAQFRLVLIYTSKAHDLTSDAAS
jgi:hypothetical protein